MENGVKSGYLRLGEGIVKRTLDLEQYGDTKAAKLDDVNRSDLVDMNRRQEVQVYHSLCTRSPNMTSNFI